MARSRTGCTNCKKRRKKCDEAQPECRACQERGLLCGGYQKRIRWSNAIASRGRFAGATTPAAPVARVALIPSTSASVTSANPASVFAELHPDTETSESSDSTADGSSHETQRALFREFMRSGYHRFYAATARSELKALFEQLSAESEALVSICATIYVYLTQGNSLRFMEQADHALRTFRAELYNQSDSVVAGTLCAGLLVCTLSQLQERPWTAYLAHIRDLYNLQGDFIGLKPDPQYNIGIQHSLEVMAIMDLRSMVLGRLSPSLGIWKRFRVSQDTWEQGRLGGVETISGIPRSLLDVFADAFDQVAQSTSYAETGLWMWPGELGDFLDCQLWEAWRYAAILNLRRWQAFPRTSTQNSLAEFSSTKGETILCRLLSSMHILLLRESGDNGSLACSSLLYPLIAARLEVSALQAHPEWKQLLDAVGERFIRKGPKKPSIQALFEILDEAWAIGNDGYDIDAAAQRKRVEIAIF